MFGSSSEMTATAENDIGAKAGDTVEIESSAKTVLSAAAFVFIFPIIAAFAAYAISFAVGASEAVSLLVALGGFVLAFIIIGFYERICKRKKISVRIVKIIESNDSACGESKR